MRTTERTIARVLVGLLAATATGLAAAIGSATANATTALLIGTTFLSDPMTNAAYVQGATSYYINPTTACGTQSCTLQPVITPETFWPFSGPDDPIIDESIAQGVVIVDQAIREAMGTGPIVVFGDSQSSSILTQVKSGLTDLSAEQKSQITLVMVANPNRPNGGILPRFTPFPSPIFGLTSTPATPTDTGISTVDIALQYDGIADLPTYPLNALALLNVFVGAWLHSSYMSADSGYTGEELIAAINNPVNRQTYGDTTYITIPAKQLPLLVPFRVLGNAMGLGALTTPLADLIEPTLKVLVELGYDRTSYGQPTTFGLFPKIDPAKLKTDLEAAVKAGIDAATADLNAHSAGSSASSTATKVASTGTKKAIASSGRSARQANKGAAGSTPAASSSTKAPTRNAAKHTAGASRRTAQRSATHSQ